MSLEPSRLFSTPGSDPRYEALREPSDTHLKECRAWVLSLWERSRPFLDHDTPEKATSDFHSVFWECFLTCGLLDLGLPLTPRVDREPRVSGPDLLISDPVIWVEAVTPRPGESSHAPQQREPGECSPIQDDQVILRIANSLDTKRKGGDRYRERGWMKPGEPYVIAVNSGILPDGKSERELPRIVRAVFPFGHEFVSYDRTTLEVTGGGHHHRSEILKLPAAPVSTSGFESPEFDRVAAVFYSTVDAFNPLDDLAAGLCLVRNPRAVPGLPAEFRPDCLTFWREGDSLLSRPRGGPGI